MTSSSDPAAAAASQGEGAAPRASLRAAHAGEVVAERYVIDCEVGRGGMGVVYRAQHVLTGRPVALKLLGRGASSTDERVLNEARSAASLRHPNVVEVLDVGVHEGGPFLVMELLTGEALSADTPGARDVSQLLRWLLPVLGAVAELHERGYVHGDLKPANVLLNQQGPHTAPKLIDFGLASAVFDRGPMSAPVYGTPRYMAPERAAGAELTVQADVWSLGMTLLECLAGQAATPGSLAAHRPDLPMALVLAVEQALQPGLHLRHATVRALARSLVEACCLTGIVLPDDPDPVGLPEVPSWRRDAHRRSPSETHSVEAEQPRPTPHRTGALVSRRTRALWTLPVLLTLGALATWAWWPNLASVASAPPRDALVQPRQEPPAPLLRAHETPRTPLAGSPLPSAPSADPRTRQQPTAEAASDATRTKQVARSKRTPLPSPETESEDDDITGEWR